MWAARELAQEHVQVSAAKLQLGSYAVLIGMYSPATQMRAAVEDGLCVVVDNRVLLVEYQVGRGHAQHSWHAGDKYSRWLQVAARACGTA